MIHIKQITETLACGEKSLIKNVEMGRLPILAYLNKEEVSSIASRKDKIIMPPEPSIENIFDIYLYNQTMIANNYYALNEYAILAQLIEGNEIRYKLREFDIPVPLVSIDCSGGVPDFYLQMQIKKIGDPKIKKRAPQLLGIQLFEEHQIKLKRLGTE